MAGDSSNGGLATLGYAIGGVAGILLLAVTIATLQSPHDDPYTPGNTFSHPGLRLNDMSREVSAPATAAKRIDTETEPLPPHGPVPRGAPSDWIKPDDYPPDALEKGQHGRVAFAITINAAGAVGNCTVTESSGFASLDDQTCRLARTRMHFFPARDADGLETTSTWRRRVIWMLPK